MVGGRELLDGIAIKKRFATLILMLNESSLLRHLYILLPRLEKILLRFPRGLAKGQANKKILNELTNCFALYFRTTRPQKAQIKTRPGKKTSRCKSEKAPRLYNSQALYFHPKDHLPWLHPPDPSPRSDTREPP